MQDDKEPEQEDEEAVREIIKWCVYFAGTWVDLVRVSNKIVR